MYSVIDICIPDSIPMLLILVYEDYVLSIISRLNLIEPENRDQRIIRFIYWI